MPRTAVRLRGNRGARRDHRDASRGKEQDHVKLPPHTGTADAGGSAAAPARRRSFPTGNRQARQDWPGCLDWAYGN